MPSGGSTGAAPSTGGSTTSGGATTGGTASGTMSAPTTTGTTAGGGANVQLSTEQRTQAVQTLRSVNITPVQENVTITVGQPVPTTVTQLVDCPATLVSLITGVRECKVMRVGSKYYIVEGSSRRVVTMIEM